MMGRRLQRRIKWSIPCHFALLIMIGGVVWEEAPETRKAEGWHPVATDAELVQAGLIPGTDLWYAGKYGKADPASYVTEDKVVEARRRIAIIREERRRILGMGFDPELELREECVDVDEFGRPYLKEECR